jgi:DNA-binding MarR family transcriptional regulator
MAERIGAPGRTAAKRTTAVALTTALRDGIVRLNRRLRQVRPVGALTQTQLSALTSLELAGSMTPRELAEVERVQPPTLTKILAKLEERGLVRRDPHPTDGRQVVLSETEEGRRVFAEQSRAKDAWLARRVGELSVADRETLAAAVEILTRLAKD